MSITRQFFNELRPLFRVLEDPFFNPAIGAGARHGGRNGLGRHRYDWQRANSLRPAVDLTENGNQYIVEAELPGVKKENVEVSVGDNGQSITIQGKVVTRSLAAPEGASTEGAPASETREVSTERQFVGSSEFLRTVWLPQPVESSKVTAKLEDGVLTVTVPKAEGQLSTVKVPVE